MGQQWMRATDRGHLVASLSPVRSGLVLVGLRDVCVDRCAASMGAGRIRQVGQAVLDGLELGGLQIESGVRRVRT
jgi:hypothetical protein